MFYFLKADIIDKNLTLQSWPFLIYLFKQKSLFISCTLVIKYGEQIMQKMEDLKKAQLIYTNNFFGVFSFFMFLCSYNGYNLYVTHNQTVFCSVPSFVFRSLSLASLP